ncbi:SRPBCC family protein [Sorangium sp. So ce131]|uniref:SRPBCC family protein n=1 Tax=Sorangium sp. So ce131 TaxID=3133282 RepID=UPI003F6141C8
MNVFDEVLRTVTRPRRHDLGDAAALAAALGIGAGLMYTFDPDRGAQRRASARDKAVGLAYQTGVLLDRSARDLRNQSRGVLANASAMVRQETVSTEASRPLSTRALMGALGIGLLGYAAKRRGLLGAVLGVAGAAVLFREIKGRPARRRLDVAVARQAVDFRRTITVRAPVREVFLALIQFESFPRFMSHLRQVEMTGDGRMCWTAVGPAGIPVSWDAELTQLVPNEVVAWRSLPGEPIESEVLVRIEQCLEGTRVDVEMSYSPHAGELRDAVAALFGADPQRALEEDLLRFKTLLEQDRTTSPGEEVLLGDLQGAR